MAITRAALAQIKDKLLAIAGHLRINPLNALNSGEDNLANLKNQICGDGNFPGTEVRKLTNNEWNDLNLEVDHDADVTAEAATELVIAHLSFAIEKITTCFNLNDAALGKINDSEFLLGESLDDLKTYKNNANLLHEKYLEAMDFAAVIGISEDNIEIYRNTISKLNSENVESLGENFKTALDKINQIKLSLNKLNPQNLVVAFNEAVGVDEFVNRLKNDLGEILSKDILQDGNTRKVDFNLAARELYDSFTKVAPDHDLNLIPSTLESVKAFIGTLIKHALIIPAVLEYLGVAKDSLQSNRAKKNEASEAAQKFVEVVRRTGPENQLITNEAKNCSISLSV